MQDKFQEFQRFVEDPSYQQLSDYDKVIAVLKHIEDPYFDKIGIAKSVSTPEELKKLVDENIFFKPGSVITWPILFKIKLKSADFKFAFEPFTQENQKKFENFKLCVGRNGSF